MCECDRDATIEREDPALMNPTRRQSTSALALYERPGHMSIRSPQVVSARGIVVSVIRRDRRHRDPAPFLTALLTLTLVGACTSADAPGSASSTEPGADTSSGADGNRSVYGEFAFGGRDRLVTNEYAHWNPDAPDARKSPVWDMTSGSLFVRNTVGYSGRPDRRAVDAASAKGTNSAVFRLVTRNRTYGDARFSMRFRMLRFNPSGDQTDDWDGLHLWLRYQDETNMYIASVARRDHTATLKRKDPGGDANGGSYALLKSTRAAVSLDAWHTAVATIRNIQQDGKPAVELTLDIDGTRVLHAIDAGDQGGPLRRPGAVGIRADNLEFEFTDVRVGPAS